MKTSPVGPTIFFALFFAWRIYVRARRNIGRQHFSPGRMIARIVIFALLSAGLGFLALGSAPSLEALGGGIVLGVPLAVMGLRLTKFERTPEGIFYTPNAVIGIGLTVLLAARVFYRLLIITTLSSGDTPTPAAFQSPLTLFIFGVTAGYYIAYGAGAMREGKLRAAPPPAAP